MQPQLFSTDRVLLVYIVLLLTGHVLQWANSISNKSGPITRSQDAFFNHYKEPFGQSASDLSMTKLHQGKSVAVIHPRFHHKSVKPYPMLNPDQIFISACKPNVLALHSPPVAHVAFPSHFLAKWTQFDYHPLIDSSALRTTYPYSVQMLISKRSENTSFITGRSVHNQRIERLWRDIWCAVTSSYYSALQCLEESGTLDIQNEMHVICLHYVMLPRINMHLDLFRRTWDNHPLSSEGNRSPQQLWIGGQLLTTETPNDPTDFTYWGVDWDGPVPQPDDVQSVEILESPTSLQDSLLAMLNESIDPLMSSSTFGTDIYQEALRLCEAVQFTS